MTAPAAQPTLTIPDFLAHLATLDGKPIPFYGRDPDHPDWDGIRRCARQRRCGMCGEHIGHGPYAFVGQAPWMHVHCAAWFSANHPGASQSVIVAPRAGCHRDRNGRWRFIPYGTQEVRDVSNVKP